MSDHSREWWRRRAVWRYNQVRELQAEVSDLRESLGRVQRCGECRMGLGTHNTADPLCDAR